MYMYMWIYCTELHTGSIYMYIVHVRTCTCTHIYTCPCTCMYSRSIVLNYTWCVLYMYMWIYCVHILNYTRCVLYMYMLIYCVHVLNYIQCVYTCIHMHMKFSMSHILLIECLFLSMCSSVEEDVPLVSKTAAVVQSKWELVDYGQGSSSEEEVEEKKKRKEEERSVASLLVMCVV